MIYQNDNKKVLRIDKERRNVIPLIISCCNLNTMSNSYNIKNINNINYPKKQDKLYIKIILIIT